MKTTKPHELLRAYAKGHSESAFQELVNRYVDLVYSAAIRRVSGDRQLAEDVTQEVFADLARKAAALPADVTLGGWLLRHTGYLASTAMRGEQRRRDRERQAVEMNALNEPSGAGWSQFAPMLDDAMDEMDAVDRDALVLRYFEQCDLRSVGEALGTTEDAAQKRVSRALEKLHLLLRSRGATLSAAALGTALATEAVTAAPAGLAGSVAGAALASVAAGGGITAVLMKLMTMTKIKFGIICIIAVAGVATTLAIQHQSRARLSPEEEARSVCINNLRHIDGAIQQYALDNKLGVDDTVTAQQVLSYLNDANVMRCPLGGTYTFGRVGDRPSCSMPGHVLPRN